MKIGIYGGSFNPIHKGHTGLTSWIVTHGYVEEVWLLVSPQNPLKEVKGLLDEQSRLRLARLAVAEEEPGLEVSDFEFSLPRPSFTVDTLAALRKAYPEHEFVLIIGADNWLAFDKWYKPDEILKHHSIIIYPRQGYDIDPASLPDNVLLVETPLFNVSSTQIRNEIATNPNYDGWGLAASVWQAIKAEKLYGCFIR